jgi:membrane protein involved in colicin uptake
MPKYRVLAKSFINNAIREAGEVVEYDGKPGKALELIPEAAAEPKLTKKEAEAKAKAEAEALAKAEAEAKAKADAEEKAKA